MRTEPKLVTLDAQPTLPRMVATTEPVLNTLLPSSKVVLLAQKRILTGFEALRLTGFPEWILKEYMQENKSKHIEFDAFFADLAGNAWAGPILCALIAAIVARSPPVFIRRFSALPQEPPSQSDSDLFENILNM